MFELITTFCIGYTAVSLPLSIIYIIISIIIKSRG
jgi:hypothetical protein